MKYIHGFITKRLKEEGITHDESLVIRYILNFINSNKMEKIIMNGEVYYWVKYSKIATDLDLLGLKEDAIGDMLRYNLSEKPKGWDEKFKTWSKSTQEKRKNYKFIGLFRRYTKKDSEGSKVYYCPTDKLYSLLPNITDNDEDMIDNIIELESKKAPSMPLEDASNQNFSNNESNDIINQSDINNTSYQKKSQCQNTTKNEFKYKVVSNKHNDSVNNTFIKYGDKLEEMLFKSQEGKFK